MRGRMWKSILRRQDLKNNRTPQLFLSVYSTRERKRQNILDFLTSGRTRSDIISRIIMEKIQIHESGHWKIHSGIPGNSYLLCFYGQNASEGQNKKNRDFNMSNRILPPCSGIITQFGHVLLVDFSSGMLSFWPPTLIPGPSSLPWPSPAATRCASSSRRTGRGRTGDSGPGSPPRSRQVRNYLDFFYFWSIHIYKKLREEAERQYIV